jgi:hypothetical protein
MGSRPGLVIGAFFVVLLAAVGTLLLLLGSYSTGEASGMTEAQTGARNVICRHRGEDPESVFRCRAHRARQPWAAMKVEIKSGKVVVNSCYAVRFSANPGPNYKPPCIGINFNRVLH